MSVRQSILHSQSTEEGRKSSFNIGLNDGKKYLTQNFSLFKDGSYKKASFMKGWRMGLGMYDYPKFNDSFSRKRKKDVFYCRGFDEQRKITFNKLKKELKGKLNTKDLEFILKTIENQ